MFTYLMINEDCISFLFYNSVKNNSDIVMYIKYKVIYILYKNIKYILYM